MSNTSRWIVTLPASDPRTEGLVRNHRYYNVAFAGLRARGYVKASLLAEELFGLNACVTRIEKTHGYARNASAESDAGYGRPGFWTKDSQYGVHYECKTCGHSNRGITDRKYMHWQDCPFRTHPKIEEI